MHAVIQHESAACVHASACFTHVLTSYPNSMYEQRLCLHGSMLGRVSELNPYQHDSPTTLAILTPCLLPRR